MKIAVIEWASDDADAPSVYAGTEEEVVRASAVAMYGRILDDDDCDVLGEEEAGSPHGRSLTGLYTWHQIVREYCTEPWVTFYDLDSADDDVRVRPDDVMNRRLLGVSS